MSGPWLSNDAFRDFFGVGAGSTTVHKFGAAVLTTSFTPIAFGNVYNMPKPAAATTLRVKAGNAADDAAGNGARTIILEGLDETGARITPTVTTAGSSAGTATTETFIRLYRAYVATSGIYADASAVSHVANLVIENGAGGTDWLTIDSTDYPKSQSEVACYSVEAGKTAYVASYSITVDGNKPVDMLFMVRDNIIDETVPYPAMREQMRLVGLAGQNNLKPKTPLGPYTGPCDLIWFGKGASTPTVSVDFEIILK